MRSRIIGWVGMLSCSLVAGEAFAATFYVDANSANPSAPFNSWSTAAQIIQEAVDLATAGDLILVTNGVYATGGSATGSILNRVAVTNAIAIRSVNGAAVTLIKGFQVPGTTNGPGAVRCAYLTNGASLTGFTLTNGATQVDPAPFMEQVAGGVFCATTNETVMDCVLLGNSGRWGGGAYRGSLSNCVIVGNWTGKYGGGSYDSLLNHCWLTNNGADASGGGAYGGTLTDCVLAENHAASDGGGAAFSDLKNCFLTGNSAAVDGGGANGGNLQRCVLKGNWARDGGGAGSAQMVNCLLTGNWASNSGGGVYAGTLYNCTVAFNSATNSGGGGWGADSFFVHANCLVYNSIVYSNSAAVSPDCQCTQYDSCLPTGNSGIGGGNISDPPQFADAAAGDFRLKSTSPCINAGRNAYLTNATDSFDLDGLARVSGGTVDLGAYEFQNPSSILSFAWLQQYGLALDGSADHADPDGDHADNYLEWRSGTNPTNSFSALRMLSANRSGGNVAVTWQSASFVNYFLQRSTNLSSVPPFVTIATNLYTWEDSLTYTDPNMAAQPVLFYRVGVSN